jgi:hypothetical protein
MGFYYGYAYVQPMSIKDKKALLILMFFIANVVFIVFLLYKRNHVLGFSLLFYNLINFHHLNIFYTIVGAMGDRYLFIPSIGFVVFVAWILLQLINSNYKKIGWLTLILILFVYCFLTVQRNTEWKDKITLFEADIEYLDKSAQAQALLGSAYMQKATSNTSLSDDEYFALLEKARFRFEKAISIYPEFLNWWYDKSRIESELGLLDEALASLLKSVELEEGFLPDPYFNIANIYTQKGELEKANFYYYETLKWGYSSPEIFNSIATNYLKLNNVNFALMALEQGLSIFPNDYDLNLNKAKILYNSGNYNEALIFFNNSFKINNSDKQLELMINKLNSTI